MGFEVSTTGSLLTFPEGSLYHGLEVRLDEAPIGMLTDIMENYSRFAGGNVDPETAAKLITTLTDGFASVLEEWNAERKGVPVPATPEGVRSLGTTFVMAVIGAWVTGKTTAGEELGKDSPSGVSSEAELTAMAALSSSLPSSSPQRLLSGSATSSTACRRRRWPSRRGCCGCSTSTGSGTATRSRRGGE